jgi:hypothetical protein
MAAAQQPNYDHLYNSGSPDIPTCSYDELCKIAKEDAWHDHGSIKGLDPYKTAAKHLNQTCEDPAKSEDTFMFDRVLANGISNIFAKPIANIALVDSINGIDPLFTIQCDNSNIHEINSGIYHYLNIQGRYRVFNISSRDPDETSDLNKAAPDAPADPAASAAQAGSLIQDLFKCLNITDDVYFIRDVAYGNFADDIYRWKDGQTATFLITSQGQYDPGPTVTCLTDAGIRIGMGHYLGGSSNRPNRATNPNVRFGIYDIDVESERVTKYPIYPLVGNTFQITGNRGTHPPQAMMSTKFDCYMVSQIDYSGVNDLIDTQPNISSVNADTILSSSNTTLFILDPSDEIGQNSLKGKVATLLGYDHQVKNIFTIDKNTSNKATTLDSVTRKISTKISGVGIRNFPNLPFDSAIYDVLYTSEEICKILSKKFGDHSQAIKTIDPIISYVEFNCLGDNKTAPTFRLSRKKSSGVHVFVTYDRVAATAALEYGAPVVLFNNHDGFLIYISNNLIQKYSTPKTILDAKLKYYIDTYNKYRHVYSEDMLDHITGNANVLNQNVEFITNNILSILGYLNEQPITDDQKYADFLKVYYVLSPILSILSDFFNFYNNVIKNINDSRERMSRLSMIDPSENVDIPQVEDQTKSPEQNAKQWVDDNIADMKTKYEANDLIYKQYLNCIESEDKLLSIYKLLLFKIRSISEKLVVCHSKKTKKRDTNLDIFINGMVSLKGNDDGNFFQHVFGNGNYPRFFTDGFIQCFPYINDLIDQGTLTELSKITPTSTLASDRFSRLFTSCISNAGGTIPSLGIPIVKIVHKTLSDALRTPFEDKIYEYLQDMRLKTNPGKVAIYGTMFDDFYKQNGFANKPQPQGQAGGKKTIGFNRTHNKSIHKSNKKTRKNNKLQKNKKLIKGGTIDPIMLNRDKLVVSMLLSQYFDHKPISFDSTDFLPEVVLLEEFASTYKTDYLYEGLTDDGKLYYKLAQLCIYIQETLKIETQKKDPPNFEQIETEITNFISEMRKNFDETDQTINQIIDLLVYMNNSAKHNNTDRFSQYYSQLHTHITTECNYSSAFPDTDKDNTEEYIKTVSDLLPQDIAQHISRTHVSINAIIKKKLHEQITYENNVSVSAQDLTKLDILPNDSDLKTIFSATFAAMSIGDFTQVLSLGSSDQGRKLLILEYYFSKIQKEINIIIMIYKSNYNYIKEAIEYVDFYFGDMFFEKYFPVMNRVYPHIRNPEIIKEKARAINAIAQLQDIMPKDKTRFNENIAYNDGNNIAQIEAEATQFNQFNKAKKNAIDEIDGLPNIGGQKHIFKNHVREAHTPQDIYQIVEYARNNSVLNSSKRDARQMISELPSLSDEERHNAIHEVDTANNVIDVNDIVEQVSKMNDDKDRTRGKVLRGLTPKYTNPDQLTELYQQALLELKKIHHTHNQHLTTLPQTSGTREYRKKRERAINKIHKKIQNIKSRIEDSNRRHQLGVGGNKTRKNRKQITYKYTKRNTKRLRKTRKNTKRPKYIKKHATKRRR